MERRLGENLGVWEWGFLGWPHSMKGMLVLVLVLVVLVVLLVLLVLLLVYRVDHASSPLLLMTAAGLAAAAAAPVLVRRLVVVEAGLHATRPHGQRLEQTPYCDRSSR